MSDREPSYPSHGPQPFYADDDVTLYHGDCRELMPWFADVPDVTITDPPYGETTLAWDRWVDGWADSLPSNSAWVFGSLRMWLERGRDEFTNWKLAQDVVWEKHNGSGLAADRFKRVHENAVQWYRGQWSSVYANVPTTATATARTVRRKAKPVHHQGARGPSYYNSEDDGPQLTRSVIYARSCHGYAVHPTQKPIDILVPLIEASCPPGGIVFDPFAGSGSTLVAARLVGRRAIGIEAREDYCIAARDRLSQQTLSAEVPA